MIYKTKDITNIPKADIALRIPLELVKDPQFDNVVNNIGVLYPNPTIGFSFAALKQARLSAIRIVNEFTSEQEDDWDIFS